jgi:hypothetical protein
MTRALLAALLGLALALPAPARAEPATDTTPPAADLDLRLRVSSDGFRLGGSLAGPAGVWGVWLNGLVRGDGFTLDGRLQEPSRALDFRFDAELRRWLSL